MRRPAAPAMADSVVNEVKERLDVVEIIGQTVQLKKAGRTYKGLCPFHGEKSPSFVVYPEDGGYKCFGCGESGDVITFVMKRDHLEFREALEELARRAGVDLPSRVERSPEQEEEHARLYAVLQAGAIYFHGLLQGAAGKQAREYLVRRGLSDDTIEQYLLGYAPQAHGALERHLAAAGFATEDAEKAGLIGTNERGQFDYFRHRVLFPIRDAQGRVVGFGGRALTDDQMPKYLNTPQTVLFDKGSLLYGLDPPAPRSAPRVVPWWSRATWTYWRSTRRAS